MKCYYSTIKKNEIQNLQQTTEKEIIVLGDISEHRSIMPKYALSYVKVTKITYSRLILNLADEWIKNLWSEYVMEYYSTFKMKTMQQHE